MIKKILQSNAIWAVIAVLINAGINFLIVPYMTKNVGVSAYGFVTLGNTLITYVDIISLALNSFASRFIAINYHQNNLKKANEYYSTIFIGNVFLAIIIVLGGIPLIIELQHVLIIPGRLVGDVKYFFLLVLIRYIFILLRNAFDVSTFIKNRLDLTEKFRTGSYVIQAATLFALCSLFRAHVWFVGVAALFAVIFLFIAQFVATRCLTPELTVQTSDFSFRKIKSLLTSGMWNSINSLGNLLNNGLDLIIANQLLGSTTMGLISVAETLGSMCYTVITAISNAFRPNQLKSYSEGNFKLLKIQLISAMRITGMFCAIIIAGFIACGQNFINLWLSGQDTKTIFTLSTIVLIGTVITGVVNPLYFVFTLTDRLIVPCLITITMGVINVGGMIALIKLTPAGATGVVITTTVLNLVHFVDTPIYAAYLLRFKYRTFYPTIAKHLINILVLVLVTQLFNLIYPDVESWMFLGIKILVFGVVEVFVSCLVLFTPRERRKFSAQIMRRNRLR